MTITDAIRATRYDSGKSQEYMALELGVTRRTVYPDIDKTSAEDEDGKILGALMQIINDLPADGVRQLMYLFFGNHGSSPRAVLHMINAHLQTPMKDRIVHGQIAATNYELACKTGSVTQPSHIQPDMEYLNAAIATAKRAVEENAKEYSRVE